MLSLGETSIVSDPSGAISLPFASLDVSSWRAAGVEQLGTKPKQWLRDDRDRLWLWKGAANVNDVAAAMVECGEGITTMRLEKLAYYCQAWHLASTLQPLFSAEIQASRDGPVVRELFRCLTGWRRKPRNITATGSSHTSNGPGRPTNSESRSSLRRP